jgi:hypothetical protein
MPPTVNTTKKRVIPTGAAHSLIVSGAVEAPPHSSLPLLLLLLLLLPLLLLLLLPLLLPLPLPLLFSCHPSPNRGPRRAVFARWGGMAEDLLLYLFLPLLLPFGLAQGFSPAKTPSHEVGL